MSLTTLLAAFLLASAPRLLEIVSTEDLRATVSEPHPARRNIRVERQSALSGGLDDPMATARAVGDTFAQLEFPDPVSSIISDSYALVDWPRFAVTPLPGEMPPHPFDMFLSFRYQEHIDEHYQLVAGSLPSRRDPVRLLIGPDCPEGTNEREQLSEEISNGSFDPPEGFECGLERVQVIEVALTTETIEALGLEVGSQMMLTPDTSDSLYLGVPRQNLDVAMIVDIAGLIDLSDPSLDYWYADPTLHRPSILETADFRVIYATGLPAPEAINLLNTITEPTPQSYTWRHFVDPDLVTEVDVDQLRDDLRLLEFEHSPVTAVLGDYRFGTSLGLLLAEHQAQREQTVAALSVAAAGVLAVALGALTLLATLMTTRQQPSLILTRNRGASTGQLVTTRTYEALILVGPFAVAGYLAAALSFPESEGALASYRTVVGFATTAMVLVVVSALRLITRRLGSLQSDIPDQRERRARRIVFETLLITTAAAAIISLRRRGQADSAPEVATFDTLLAVAPVLVAAAAGIILLRVFPIAVRGFSALAARTRGVVGFVSLRRVLARVSAENLPIAVVLVCVSIAAVASIIGGSIDSGQERASWQSVGADYTVEGFREGVNLPLSVDVGALDQAQASAMGKSFGRSRVTRESGAATVDVLAIDVRAYRQVSEGGPLEVDLPDDLVQPAAAGPIPVVVSSNWPGPEQPSVGEVMTIDLVIGGLRPSVVVADIQATFPGIPGEDPFVVVDLRRLETVSEVALTPTVGYLKAPTEAAEELSAGVAAQSGTARLFSRFDFIDDLARDPFISWGSTAFEITFWIAIIFGVISGVGSLALTASARHRDLAYLRTLGLNNHQAASVTMIEQLPGVILGTFGGIVTGAIVILLLEPAIVLTGLAGGSLPVGLEVNWTALGIVATAVTAAQTLAIGIVVLVRRDEELSRIVRVAGADS